MLVISEKSEGCFTGREMNQFTSGPNDHEGVLPTVNCVTFQVYVTDFTASSTRWWGETA